MLDRPDPQGTLVSLDIQRELALQELEAAGEQQLLWGGEVSELELLKHEIRELRRELAEARQNTATALRLVRRTERLVAGQAERRARRKGGSLARGILRVMVAMLTLGGAVAGAVAAFTVIRVWGDSGVAIGAAAVAGLGMALVGWLGASLAALVIETADAVRELP